MAIQTIYTGNRILDNFLSNIYKILNQLAQRLDKAALKTDLDNTNKVLDSLGAGGGIDHTTLINLNTANYTHLTAVNHTDLTDGGVTTLHEHTNDHVAATVADTDSVDMSITGQQISAETIGLTDTITFVE